MNINNKATSITIGSFDGLHLAHQELVSQVDVIVVIERNSGYLTPGYKRIWYTDKPVVIYQFDNIKHLDPKEFLKKLYIDFPYLKKIVVGYDFHFGKDKIGNAKILKELFGGEVIIVDQITLDGIPAHSKEIKKMISKGDIKGANRLLGRSYCVDGTLIRGQGIGSSELVPTLNLSVQDYILPADGVYATRTKLNGIWHDSVSFIGRRVTTDNSFAVESHIIDQTAIPTQKTIFIEFVDKIRDNVKFSTLHLLKKQIIKDIKNTKKVLK